MFILSSWIKYLAFLIFNLAISTIICRYISADFSFSAHYTHSNNSFSSNLVEIVGLGVLFFAAFEKFHKE